MKELEEVNSRGKRIMANALWQTCPLRLMRLKQYLKKVQRPDGKREVVALLMEEKLSIRPACKLVKLPRSVMQYRRKPKQQDELITALQELVDKYPAIVCWKCY